MKNTIRASFRQVSWVRFVLLMMAMVLVVFFSCADSLICVARERGLLAYEYHTDLVLTALRSDSVAPFLPILAALPFAGSYVDDVKGKFARFILIRTSYLSYLFGRALVCFLSGGLVILSGALLAWASSALLFMPMERAVEAPSESTAILLKTYVLLFLNGGLWAVMGMAISTLMESKYIAYVSPFILYYLLVILYERYFPKWFLIYPREWMNPSDLWPLGFWGPAILMIELTFLCSLLFVFRAGRRLREL